MTVLESARYFADEAGVPCAICEGKNIGKEGTCHRCLAPLELSRSIAARGRPPQFLSVLGASGVGKTVYLGLLLDILSKGREGIQGLPNGSFSVSVQQETISSLQHHHFPEKTPSEADNWKWVHCEVTSERRPKDCLDLITPDLAGEAIALEMEQPGTYETIRVVVSRSTAMMVLIDSLRARDGGRDEDLFAMRLVSYVHSLHAEFRRGKQRKINLPVALVFTKSDLCPDALEDPQAFASANVPGLMRFCEHNLARFCFFAAGVVGTCATLVDDHGGRLRIPLRVEPRGVVEPLQWLVESV
jgi:hypothetical protein